MSAQGDGIGAKLTGESGEEFTWLQGLRGISSSLDDAWSGHRPTPFPDTDPILAMREDSVFRHGKDLACRKAKELGYPHEMWTTRLLASHAREHGPAEEHGCLAKPARAPCARSSISRR
jgi:hypothetical protein